MARRIGAKSAERSVPTLTRNRRQAATPQSAQPTGPNRPSGARGGVQGVNLIILILVAVSVTIAAGLLAKTVNTARSIDGKAKSISSTGGTINASTDAIAELVKTNKIARSILKTASPLEGVLTKIEARAKSINSDATSIDGLASSILSTAGTVNTTATSINGSATSINCGRLGDQRHGRARSTASRADQQRRRLDQLDGEDHPQHRRPGLRHPRDRPHHRRRRERRSSADPNRTIAIAQSIKVDSGLILEVSDQILDTASCIDYKLPGPNKPPNQCQGRQP